MFPIYKMSQPQIVKYIPKNLYSNYSLLTISDIISDETVSKVNTNTQEQQQLPPSDSFPLSQVPFKLSQRKVLRSSKR